MCFVFNAINLLVFVVCYCSQHNETWKRCFCSEAHSFTRMIFHRLLDLGRFCTNNINQNYQTFIIGSFSCPWPCVCCAMMFCIACIGVQHNYWPCWGVGSSSQPLYVCVSVCVCISRCVCCHFLLSLPELFKHLFWKNSFDLEIMCGCPLYPPFLPRTHYRTNN